MSWRLVVVVAGVVPVGACSHENPHYDDGEQGTTGVGSSTTRVVTTDPPGTDPVGDDTITTGDPPPTTGSTTEPMTTGEVDCTPRWMPVDPVQDTFLIDSEFACEGPPCRTFNFGLAEEGIVRDDFGFNSHYLVEFDLSEFDEVDLSAGAELDVWVAPTLQDMNLSLRLVAPTGWVAGGGWGFGPAERGDSAWEWSSRDAEWEVVGAEGVGSYDLVLENAFSVPYLPFPPVKANDFITFSLAEDLLVQIPELDVLHVDLTSNNVDVLMFAIESGLGPVLYINAC